MKIGGASEWERERERLTELPVNFREWGENEKKNWRRKQNPCFNSCLILSHSLLIWQCCVCVWYGFSPSVALGRRHQKTRADKNSNLMFASRLTRCGSISKNFSNCNALARKQWPGNSSHTLQRLYTGRDYNSVELTFLFFLLFGFADVWLKTAETRGQTWKCRFAGENNSKLRVTAP